MTYPTLDTLLLERRGPVGWLINNRPDRLNAMNAHMRTEFETAWRTLDEDPEVRVIVHTGEGRAFQTGVDVMEIAEDGIGFERYRESTEKFDYRFTAWQNHILEAGHHRRQRVVRRRRLPLGRGSRHRDRRVSTAQFFDPHVSVGQVVAMEAIGLARKIPFEAVMRMALVGRSERVLGPARARRSA